jgi:Phosphatidylserine decarboxylase
MKRHFGISIHKEGKRMLLSFAFFLTALNIFCFYIAGGLVFIISLCLSIILMIFFTNFFRSPRRIFIPDNDYDIVAPADGKVVVIEPVFEDGLLKEERLQVSIFMSVTDVHANWYPFEGDVIHYSHQKGRYQAAFLPKSSTENDGPTSSSKPTSIKRRIDQANCRCPGAQNCYLRLYGQALSYQRTSRFHQIRIAGGYFLSPRHGGYSGKHR